MGSEVVYSPQPTAAAENRWTCTVCLHDVDRDKFTSTFFTCSKDFSFKVQQSGGSIVIPYGRTDGRAQMTS